MKNLVIVGCYHSCPMSDGAKLHIGGEALKGSTSVLAEKKAIIRDQDPLQCKSPSLDKAIATSSVKIEGKIAASTGDMTQHGGIITPKGAASSIFIL